jgi:alpha-L-arabinofuranosidase
LYLAHEDRFVVTPVGHVFEMYAAHQGGTSLRTVFSAPAVKYDRDGKSASFWGLNGSASLHGKDLVLSVVNPDTSKPRATEIVVRGGSLKSASAVTLTGSDIHAHNTFDNPIAVAPKPADVSMSGGILTHTVPPASVTILALHLG